MPPKWSKSRCAINTGYGIHPEYLFKGPYGTIATRTPSRGGKALVKGSKAAKLYMARLRAMRGRGYNIAALRGSGLAELASSLAKAIGGQAWETIQKIAERLKVKAIDLLKDPDNLIKILKDIAPKIATAVKKFFDFFRMRRNNPNKGKETLKEKIIVYLKFLKDMNMDLFEREIKKLKDFLMQAIVGDNMMEDEEDDVVKLPPPSSIPQLPWYNTPMEDVD